MPIVGNDESPVGMKLEAVWPAVVLDDQVPFAGAGDAKNAPKGNVHHPQVSLGIETRPLQKAVNVPAMQVGDNPGLVGTRLVQVTGQFEGGFGGERQRGVEQGDRIC